MITKVTFPHCTLLQVQVILRLKTNKQTNKEINKTATDKSCYQSGKFVAKRLQ